jgi:hypothetical protein
MENGEPWMAAVAEGGHKTLDGGGDGVVKAPCDGGSWRGDVPMWTQDGRKGGGERRTVGVGVVEAIWEEEDGSGGGRPMLCVHPNAAARPRPCSATNPTAVTGRRPWSATNPASRQT